jgi:hypothetical protein
MGMGLEEQRKMEILKLEWMYGKLIETKKKEGEKPKQEEM